MFDVGASELLLIVIVAIVVIGPKDMPLALRTAGKWIGKMRRVSGHFRSGLETMIREAELEEMERKWREQNEAIMKASDGCRKTRTCILRPHPPKPPWQLPENAPAMAQAGRPTAAAGQPKARAAWF
jgi:sec-independent protein translocase protein TatB